MSFKNKMKNRGISKLDKLVETPDYITPPTPKKVSWNWLKIAIPVTAGLALIIIPVSILGATGAFNARNANKGGAPSSDNSASYDPEYNWDPAPSDASPSSGDESYNGDTSFEALLTRNHVNENCVIEVYDYADGYMEPTYGENFIYKICFSRRPKAWWLLIDFPQYFFIPFGLLQGQWSITAFLELHLGKSELYRKFSCLSHLTCLF